MTFDIFTITIIFLFFPGIIGIKLKNYLLHRRHQINNFIFLIESFILGISSYLILFVLYKIFDFITFNFIFQLYKIDINTKHPLKLYFLEFISSNENIIKPTEIIFASLISILIIYFYAKIILNDNFFNFLHQNSLTNEFYTDTVIDHLYLSKKHSLIQEKFIFVRDKKESLIYYGFLEYYYFHKNNLALELFLTDVTVFSDKLEESETINNNRIIIKTDTKNLCKELYEAGDIYLCKNLNDIIIEFPKIPVEEVNKNA